MPAPASPYNTAPAQEPFFTCAPQVQLPMTPATTPTAFEVIVIGGGHAGTEAALAAARMGARTLLLTQSIETLGQMSCNPAIGGIGKGHLVREIDALGGVMARAADHAGIQFRTLNASKGPAVRATRAQADRQLYRQAIRAPLENQPNLSLFQQEVADLMVEGGRVRGVVTVSGIVFAAPAVVLTVGTFLGGRIHVGLDNTPGGRAGDPPVQPPGRAPARAARCGSGASRPARRRASTAARSTIRCMRRSPAMTRFRCFRSSGEPVTIRRQVDCFITHTNERTHEIIRAATDRSPLFTGVIEGVGPRYCPSVEDKVVRFAEQDLATRSSSSPRGWTTHEVYPNGISTSLPFDVQYELVRSIRGFEHAHLTRPGYAIEYDFFDPRDLEPLARDAGLARPVLRRPDQRHHRLRGGGRPGTARRHQCRAAGARARSRGCHGAARPTSACWSMTWSPGAPASPTACSPAAPSTGCCCARTTPTCASRPPVARWGWWTRSAGAVRGQGAGNRCGVARLTAHRA